MKPVASQTPVVETFRGIDIRAGAIGPEWTLPRIKTLIGEWLDGKTTPAIGRGLKLTKNAVVGKAARLGLPVRPSPIKRRADKPDVDRVKFVGLWVRGISVRTIADAVDISESAVAPLAKAMGLAERGSVVLVVDLPPSLENLPPLLSQVSSGAPFPSCLAWLYAPEPAGSGMQAGD